MDNILPSPFPLHSATTPEKHVKNVHRGGKRLASHPSFFDGLFPSTIIQVSLLWVGQNLIGLRNQLEFLSFVGVLVRMIFQSKFSVCLLNFIQRGFWFYAKKVVVTGFPNHLDYSSFSTKELPTTPCLTR
uniref:Uncharacterized protein n=1 Tax=Anguilla anguilla TaxID=7936 RepID=A0A0E9XGL3_ANGAN